MGDNPQDTGTNFERNWRLLFSIRFPESWKGVIHLVLPITRLGRGERSPARNEGSACKDGTNCNGVTEGKLVADPSRRKPYARPAQDIGTRGGSNPQYTGTHWERNCASSFRSDFLSRKRV